jgi:hypothetical protein
MAPLLYTDGGEQYYRKETRISTIVLYGPITGRSWLNLWSKKHVCSPYTIYLVQKGELEKEPEFDQNWESQI